MNQEFLNGFTPPNSQPGNQKTEGNGHSRRWVSPTKTKAGILGPKNRPAVHGGQIDRRQHLAHRRQQHRYHPKGGDDAQKHGDLAHKAALPGMAREARELVLLKRLSLANPT